MPRHLILTMALIAPLACVAAWATTSGGQEKGQDRAAERQGVIVVQPTPAMPGTPPVPPGAIFAPVVSPRIPGGDVLLHVQGPGMEPLDEESRGLLEEDRAHEESTRQLLQQYRAAESGSDRSSLQEKLASTVRKHFEVRQQLREKELATLEARIRRLRELHEKREDAKDEIVQQRVEQLTREAEGLGWGSGEHATFPNLPGSGAFNPNHPQIREERTEVRAPRVSR